MFRVSLLLSFALVAPGFAQRDPAPKDGMVTVKLSLQPTAAPAPLSKMSLYPEYGDLTPGNRVQGLMKTFMEQDHFFRRVNSEDWQKLLDLSLAELPEKIHEKEGIAHGIAYGDKSTLMMGYLDKGARYSTIDWNEWFDLRKDGFRLLLPEVQKMRTLASVARLRMRGEIKSAEYAKAATSVKTLFGMGQALEQHPTLIGDLVGIAIDHFAVNGLEEMIQQPGCPNLYWALTDIPQPLISLRKGIGGERLFADAQFDRFLKPDRALTDKEMTELFGEFDEMLGLEDHREGEVLPKVFRRSRVRYATLAVDTTRMKAARERLVAEGRSQDGIKSMTDLQIAILDDYHRYEILRDESFMAMNLNYPEAKASLDKSDERLKAAKAGGDIVGPILLPAVWRVKLAQTRLDQRIAYLRVIEALRLFAHEHKGQLPEKMGDAGVPIPLDPVTGKVFDYSRKDGQATLSGGNANPSQANTNRVYELTIRK